MRIDELIMAGHYSQVHPNINFMDLSSGNINMIERPRQPLLVCFGTYLKTDEVLEELDKLNLVPADIYETLEFGAKYSSIGIDYTVVGLKTIFELDKIRRVPCIGRWFDGRRFYLGGIGGEWPDRYHFLVFQNI